MPFNPISSAYRPFLWLIPVIVLTAVVISFLEKKEEQSFEERVYGPTETVLLIGYNDEAYPGKGIEEFQTVGCEDALVPMKIPVVSGRLVSILNALSHYEPVDLVHNPMKEQGLKVTRLIANRDGSVMVSLQGETDLGGLCDTPRLKGQIEETIRLYAEEFTIELNGSAEEWEGL